MTRSHTGPLAGIRIIEVGHMLAGPYCGMLLADLGAEVVKIEAPPAGDIARSVGPHKVGSHNTYFASLNRGKKSVVLDLATAHGQSVLHELAKEAQGLITNLRPSAIKKLGLTHAALRSVNPHISCLALTGYGLDGPFADRPAYDYVIQALAGIMALTGDPDSAPVKVGYSTVDNSSGIMGAFALLAMIHEGKGGQVDVSLYDVVLSQMNYLASAYLNAGDRPQRQRSGAHPYIVPAQIFETSDGHLALFVTHDEFWRRFAEEAGKPEWLTDPRFATMLGRAENRDTVLAEISALMRAHTTGSWVERLGPLGLVVAGVETLDTALDSELTQSRNMVVHVPTDSGDMRLVGCPVKIEGREPVYGPPPDLGQHTEDYAGPAADGEVARLAHER